MPISINRTSPFELCMGIIMTVTRGSSLRQMQKIFNRLSSSVELDPFVAWDDGAKNRYANRTITTVHGMQSPKAQETRIQKSNSVLLSIELSTISIVTRLRFFPQQPWRRHSGLWKTETSQWLRKRKKVCTKTRISHQPDMEVWMIVNWRFE